MNFLVTGAAGYIGSHVIAQILKNERGNVFALDLLEEDDLCIKRLEGIGWPAFFYRKLDLNDWNAVKQFFAENHVDVVLHFAALISVPESVADPLKYYQNNTCNTTNLINCALRSGVSKFIFSSTAAVYGETGENEVDEQSPTNPINPYGQSKLFSEKILRDTSKAHPSFKHVILRYFNVAGADTYDQNCPPLFGHNKHSTHLIKVAAECALGKREFVTIYGDDFATKDGTGVRDYIHVDDLAFAHLCVLDYLDKHESDTFNVGYGQGYSVKEVIEAMRRVTGAEIPVKIEKRRPGDPSTLVANSDKLVRETCWRPRFNDLDTICHRAYLWERELN